MLPDRDRRACLSAGARGPSVPLGARARLDALRSPEGLTAPEWIEILREVEAEFSAVPMILDRALHGGPPVCATAAATSAATDANWTGLANDRRGADWADLANDRDDSAD